VIGDPCSLFDEKFIEFDEKFIEREQLWRLTVSSWRSAVDGLRPAANGMRQYRRRWQIISKTNLFLRQLNTFFGPQSQKGTRVSSKNK
jgi:hypothetical protein